MAPGVFVFLAAIFFSPIVNADNFAYIVVDGQTGATIRGHRVDESRPPASLTKIMTCYLLFEAIKRRRIGLNTKFRVSKRATEQEPTNLWLKEGTFVSVKNLIMALITRSANDMAVTAAEGLAGSVENFARAMTLKARDLGMNRTNFSNPTGLPDKRQFTTARDMAILSRALFQNFPNEYKLFKTKVFYHNGKPIHNHNRMLDSFSGVDGIKTGFTFASRFNIAVSAARTGLSGRPVRVFAVVLGGQTSVSRDKKAAELMESAFSRLKAHPVGRGQNVFTRRVAAKAGASLNVNSGGERMVEALLDSLDEPKIEVLARKSKKRYRRAHRHLPVGWVRGGLKTNGRGRIERR